MGRSKDVKGNKSSKIVCATDKDVNREILFDYRPATHRLETSILTLMPLLRRVDWEDMLEQRSASSQELERKSWHIWTARHFMAHILQAIQLPFPSIAQLETIVPMLI